MKKRRILFTTGFRDKNSYYDNLKVNTVGKNHPSTPLMISSSLRFIRNNIPGIQILEYPTWKQYCAVLKKGWDILGFSFYLHETHKVLKMVEYARLQRVGEIWGGNYGVLTEEIQGCFDRIFLGHAEHEIAEVLGERIERIKHPPLIEYVAPPFGIGRFKWKSRHFGNLHTTMGCTMNCTFCQTAAFCKKITSLPIESIDEVLRYYRKMGIYSIMILDESFGINPAHAEAAIRLLEKYKFTWGCISRADLLKNRLKDWTKRGLMIVLVGIENLNQKNLDSVCKKEKIEEIQDIVKMIKNLGLFAYGLYMIGFETETAESIKQDIEALVQMDLNFTQVCILTPLPQTSLKGSLEQKFGKSTTDFSQFDCKHLVWSHPNIPKNEMEDLLKYAFKRLNPPDKTARLWKIMRDTDKPYWASRHWWQHSLQATFFNYNKQRYIF